MHTGANMVGVTRFVFDEQSAPTAAGMLSALGHTPADTLLRKLCASCHLGHDKTQHRLDSPFRGGGCLACHLGGYPEEAHPALTTRVGDERCFGCHARSSRISLSYAGLAEVDADTPGVDAGRGRLRDGRLVQHRAADLHHRAGLSCIDCHTKRDVMGPDAAPSGREQAVDIACSDCHLNRSARVRVDALPPATRARIPYAVPAAAELLVTARHGTPLWHIEVREHALLLHRKVNGGVVQIPPYTAASHALQAQHARLTCSACHSQWAPQCYGCHQRYDPDGAQWDHVAQRSTPGRWESRRANVRNDLPPLGVTAAGQIAPFVPGMILTASHPAWSRPKFRRLFAAISPHTSGRARSCASCHRSPTALGLGRGTLRRDGEGWEFAPRQPILDDGLPADAWTALDREQPVVSTRIGDRSFTRQEMLRVLEAYR
jgi:predicted CXXCH cytochrome family protein